MIENDWIFISSHFDDVVLSTGGLVWELTSRGARVEIWTICAGDPPAGRTLPEQARLMHEFWGIGDDVPLKRSLEDAVCCRMLGAATWRRDTIPDGIYRYLPGSDNPAVLTDDDLMKDPEPQESYLIPQIADFLRKNLPEGYEVAVPLAIGNHRDHILTRQGAEALGIPLWYYADYPYLVHGEHQLSDFVPENSRRFTRGISPKGVKVWQDAFACHRSQIPLLFADEEDMRSSIARYHQGGYGATLYQF